MRNAKILSGSEGRDADRKVLAEKRESKECGRERRRTFRQGKRGF